MLNWADYILIAIISLSVLISLARGFVREALSLTSWIAAFWVAFTFGRDLSVSLEPLISHATVRTAVAYATLFIVTLIVGAIVNYLVGQLVDKTGLSGTDRLLGTFFGFARGILLVSILLLVAHLTPLPQDKWWQASALIPRFAPIQMWLKNFLPDSVSSHFVLVKSK